MYVWISVCFFVSMSAIHVWMFVASYPVRMRTLCVGCLFCSFYEYDTCLDVRGPVGLLFMHTMHAWTFVFSMSAIYVWISVAPLCLFMSKRYMFGVLYVSMGTMHVWIFVAPLCLFLWIRCMFDVLSFSMSTIHVWMCVAPLGLFYACDVCLVLLLSLLLSSRFGFVFSDNTCLCILFVFRLCILLLSSVYERCENKNMDRARIEKDHREIQTYFVCTQETERGHELQTCIVFIGNDNKHPNTQRTHRKKARVTTQTQTRIKPKTNKQTINNT